MSPVHIGLFYCLSFVALEAFQAVFLGSVFQGVDSFLIGAWVFGLSVVFCVGVTALFRPDELAASLRAWRIVLRLNIIAALAWATYFIAIQTVEPAVVFTIFSGMVPLGAVIGAWLGLPEAMSPRRRLARIGDVVILLSILLLSATTIAGYSGFVRGGWYVALLGVSLSAASGGLTAFVILYSVRLNRRGVGPLAQFGLRFFLYTIVSILASWIGLDSKGAAPPAVDIAWIVVIGLLVIAFPLYLVQKAVPLIHVSAITAIAALGPAMVFVMQLADGRIDYSNATLAGLTIYVAGALMAVFGATRSPSQPVSPLP